MLPLLRLAELAAEAYVPLWAWETEGRVRARRFEEGGYTVVAIQGTTRDGFSILRDMRAAPWWHPGVGFCPAGALKGARDLLILLLRDLSAELHDGRVVIVGHSLGGQIGFILAGLLVSIGMTPAGVVAFDPSRAGFYFLRRQVSQIPFALYTWHGVDIVPWVPWGYRHPARRLQLGPRRNRLKVLWSMLWARSKPELCPAIADHRIAAIVEAVRAYESTV